MAAIEQIIQIAVNERTASSAQTDATTAIANAATAQTRADLGVTNAAAAQTTADGAIQHSAFTVNQTAIDSGYITVTGSGNSRTFALSAPTAVNLSDVRTFTNATARNAFTNSDGWHTGDIAILTESEQRAGEMQFTATSFAYNAFVTSTTFRVNGGWDNANNRPVSNLGFAQNSIIRFRLFGDTRIAGSTQGGTDFTVQGITQQAPGSSNAIVEIDRSTLPADSQPPVDTGSTILAGMTTPGANIVSGTYLYVGTTSGENETGVTVDNDWVLLTVPAGTAGNDDLATFRLDTSGGTGTASRLDALTYNSSTDVLTINGNTIELATTTPPLPTITRNHFQYTGPTINILGIGETGTDGVQTIPVATNATNWTNRLGGAAVGTSWPTNSATLSIDSNNALYGTAAQGGEWTFTGNGTGISITISQEQRRRFPVGHMEPITLEMETLVLSQ